jgi:hypothetical protein
MYVYEYKYTDIYITYGVVKHSESVWEMLAYAVALLFTSGGLIIPIAISVIPLGHAGAPYLHMGL